MRRDTLNNEAKGNGMVTRSNTRSSRWAGLNRTALGLTAALLSLVAIPAVADAPGFVVQALESATRANPPLPPTSQFPVQLVLDDDTPETSLGVTQGQGAKQFLWLQRFTPGTAMTLEEIWVLFPTGVSAGAAIDLAVYGDTDGNLANGATLLTSFASTVQVADGNTFSIYPLPGPLFFDGVGDLILGVVPRFIVSGVTPVNNPATIDTSAPQGRAWLAVWQADPPSPPVLTPLPDLVFDTLDTIVPTSAGNWMIRGFGTAVETIGVPTLDIRALGLLVVLLGTAAFWLLRRRSRAALLGMLIALAATAMPASAQITIDTFTTNQATLSAPPDASSAVTGGADIIGTRRNLVVRTLTGAGPTTAAVAGGNLTLTVTATTPDSRGVAEITWDGDTNPAVLSHTGLGGANLTTGNASGFRLAVVSATVATELEMRVWSSAANWSRASLRVPVTGSATNFFLPYSEFIVGGGTGASFTSVGAIQLFARNTEGVFTLNEVIATAPAVAATKVDALINDVDGDLRADPGDRVRYTITITNTGNEARSVNLADTVDANTTLVTGSVSSTPIAKNDQYAGFGNVPLSADGSPGKPGLLANDSDPDGDTLTVTAVDATSAAGGSVSLVNAATGTFTYSPPAGFSGVDSFNYTIQDNDAHSTTAMARITLQGVVWFVDDTNVSPPHLGTLTDPFPALTNVNGAGGVGDPDGPNDIIFVFDDDGTPYAGGIQLEAGQTLLGEAEGLILGGETIVPVGNRPQITHAAGVGVTLSTNNTLRGFDVQGSAGVGIAGASFGTLTTTNLNVLSAGGAALDLNTGALFAAFGTLSSAGTGGQRGILLQTVSGSLNVTTTTLTNPSTHGIRVNDSPGATLDFGSTTITDNAVGSGPTAIGIDVATNNAGASFTFDSLSVTTDAGTGLLANNSGTINIAGTGNTINATGGAAVDITSTSLGAGVTFATLTSTNSLVKGVNLDTVTGNFVANGGAISNAGGVAFDLNGGSSTVTYAGTISNIANVLLIDVTARTGGTTTFSGNLSSTSNGNGINASSNTGGTIAFTGATKTLNTGTDTAVNLASNAGATINFTGGGLDIDTTSGSGFNATGGATAITVQGLNNTIASTTGTALNVVNTTIGVADLTFQSISANGGTNNGIVLNNTGPTGNLVVTGNGGAGTGGTIQSKPTGISLTNTTAPSFSWMQLNDFGDFAIRGSSVVGFNLDNSVISGTNGDAVNEGSVRFTELTGSATVSSSNISGASENNFTIVNTTGSLNRVTFSNLTVGANSNALGSDGLFVETQGSAVINVTVQNSFFTSSRGDLLQFNQGSSGSMDAVISGTAFSDNHPAIVAGGGGVIIGGTAGTMTFNVSGNSFRDSTTSAFAVSCGNAGQTCTGRIENNVVGVAAIPNSGSTAASGIAVVSSGGGTLTALVNNNQIRQYNNHGILLQVGQTLGNPTTFSATVTNNTISNPGNLSTNFNGIHLNNGTVPGETFTSCVDIRSNSIAGAGAGAVAPNNADFRLRQRQNTTVRLPGYAGANNNDAAVVTFVSGNQTTVSTGAASNTVGSGGGGFVGGAACPTPP